MMDMQKTLELPDIKRQLKNTRLLSPEKMNQYRKLCNIVHTAARSNKE